LIHLIDITNEDLEKNYQQVKNELVNYSKNLLEKKEIIILNKTDLLDSTEIKRIMNNFSKNKNSEVLALSTLEKNSVSKIKAKLLSYVS
jgi:GTP-binding protein